MMMNPPGNQTEKGIRDHRPRTILFFIKFFTGHYPSYRPSGLDPWKRGAREQWIYPGVPVGSGREVHDKAGSLVITALVRVRLPQTELFYTSARFHYFFNPFYVSLQSGQDP